MEQAIKVFAEYAAAFEKTYVDDDWLRLTDYFSEDATYEIRGGPLACKISGREAILAGLKKSINGFDRRFSNRRIALTDGPNTFEKDNGHEVSIGWDVIYQCENAPELVLPGRSVFTISDGMITTMRDEYDDSEMKPVVAWLLEYGEGLDGSYV